ncbi:MAG TPA: ABC transporter permease [Bdellovibrionales bacterium]|nr:ABC transporter permease [Bdellovibrionales bacterium]
MVRSALNRKLVRDLKALRTQTVTIALLVICGVSLLVSAWSAYDSLKTARSHYYSEYGFADLFADLKRAPRRAADELKRVPGVEVVEDRIVTEGLVKMPNQPEPAVGRFISVPSGEQPLLNRLHLRAGRLPVNGSQIEVVVHEGFAQAQKLKIGDSFHVLLQGQNRKLNVAGIAISPEYVYALSPSAPLPDDTHFGIFWVSRRALEEMTGMSGSFNNVVAKLEPAASIARIKSEADRILKPYGNLGAYGRDRQLSAMFVEDEIRQQRASSIFSPAIFLTIAAFLVHIISSRLISLHRPQIATMKALGYSSSKVFTHYLKLIVVMMAIGALPGIALGGLLGIYFTNLYRYYFRFPELSFSLDMNAALIGIAAGIIPGILGALTSLAAAARLRPAEAMRPPSPPAFHANLLDNIGLIKNATAQSKLIWRNLFFRPARLALVVLGISAAVAVVVASAAWGDMINYLIETQFQRIQREDVAITFLSPQKQGGLRELANMEGVIAVEGYRNVPARIRFLNHKRELGLMGWPESAQMRQRLDSEFQTIPLPDHGLLLSRFFQKKWDMRPGQLVDIEILEGAQRTIQVSVTGFTDDLIGISASMKIEELWRILQEEESYNMAALKADPNRMSELYVRLQELPKVGSVSIRRALYKGLETTFGEMIRASTLVLILFALVIAVGIVYNSVRVSFSERAWEMASLRVLGFDKSSVFGMLLSEVGVQVLFAAVPGCLLGFYLVHLSVKLIHMETFGFPVVIKGATYAEAVLVVLVALAISSWAVYRMISRLSLAEALKARE